MPSPLFSSVRSRARLLALGLVFTLPHPAAVAPVQKSSVILAGGCFWGVEAVYRHVKGVKSAISGFAVPEADTAGPPSMLGSKPAYAEAVRIEYDSSVVSYDQLMAIFFTVAHDPTQVGRQGPDIGPEYRSVIFVTSDAERVAAESALERYRTNGTFTKPLTTEIARLQKFKTAEALHQDYVAKNPRSPYVVQVDLPKLEHLNRAFPELYRK